MKLGQRLGRGDEAGVDAARDTGLGGVLVSAAGVTDIKGKLLKGHRAGQKQFKAHLDGYDFLPFLTGKVEQGPRREFLYFSDDGLLVGVRVGDWKTVFAEQRARRFDVWRALDRCGAVWRPIRPRRSLSPSGHVHHQTTHVPRHAPASLPGLSG